MYRSLYVWFSLRRRTVTLRLNSEPAFLVFFTYDHPCRPVVYQKMNYSTCTLVKAERFKPLVLLSPRHMDLLLLYDENIVRQICCTGTFSYRNRATNCTCLTTGRWKLVSKSLFTFSRSVVHRVGMPSLRSKFDTSRCSNQPIDSELVRLPHL